MVMVILTVLDSIQLVYRTLMLRKSRATIR